MGLNDFWLEIFLLLSVVVVSVTIVAVRERKLDWLHPVCVFGLSTVCGFLIPLGPFLRGIDGFSLRFPNEMPSVASIKHALMLAASGSLAFTTGYFLTTLHESSRKRPTLLVWSRKRFVLYASALTVAGLSLFSIGIAMLGGLGQLLSSLGDRVRMFEGKNYFFQSILVVLSVILVHFIRLCRRSISKSELSKFLLLYSVVLALIGLLGNKSTLFVAVVAALVIYSRLQHRLGALAVALTAVMLVVGLSVYSVFAREYLVMGALQSVDKIDLENLWQVVQVELSGNFIQLQTLSVLVEGMPSRLEWQFGRTPLALVTMPIPRLLWPGKLLPATGPFTEAFFPTLENSGTTIPPGLFGEWFMNFGSIGAVLGMLLFGALYGLLASSLKSRQDDQSILAYAVMVGLLPHYIRGEMVSASVAFLIIFLPAYALIRLSYARPQGR